MTIVPIGMRKPLCQFKLVYGFILAMTGVAELYATLTWLKNFFSEFGFGGELGHWGPVAIFALLGILLIFHAQRMIRNLPISLFEFVESFAVLAAVIGTTATNI